MSTSVNPSVAIILVNWNGIVFTRKCLSSIQKNDYPNYIVIVVDNGSDEKEGKQLKIEFPEIHLIELPNNIGFTGGNNTGMKLAFEKKQDFVLLLNNDTTVQPEFLSSLVRSSQNIGSNGIFQALILNEEGRTIWNAGGKLDRIFWKSKVISKDADVDSVSRDAYPVEWITGCCILASKEAVTEVGLLDDKFFAYFEDVDWSLRFTQVGYALYCVPESIVYHDSGKSLTRSTSSEGHIHPVSHYLNIRNHLWLIRKHTRGIALVFAGLYQLYKILGYSLYFISRGRLQKLKASWQGFRDGLKGKMGAPDMI